VNKVTAVVVTYNRKVLLAECLKALLLQNHLCDKIIVVDNNSTDGTQEYIRQLVCENQIKYIYMKKNTGGAGGFHYGIKEALKENTDYLWVMDDDTIPTPECLSKLIEAANALKQDFGFIASKVIWTDGKPCVMNIPKVDVNWMYNSECMEAGLLRLESASFVSLLINREAVIKYGLPIKEFFIWGDDLEFTRRISRRKPSFYCNKSIVVHKMVANEGTDIFSDSGIRLNRYVYLFRNNAFIARQQGKKFFMKWLFNSLWQCIKLIFKSPDCRVKRCSVVVRGIVKGCFFKPTIEFVDEVFKK